jgi:prephenate dehydrogenase
MNNILIIGMGLIGGSIAKSLHTNNHELNIFAFDQNSAPISIAMDEGIIKEEINIFNNFNSIYENEIDLIIIATPGSVTKKTLLHFNEIGLLNSDITITDTASSKSGMLDDFDNVSNLVLSHPMSGSDQSGYKAAYSELYENKKTIVLNPFSASDKHLQIVMNLWKLLGSTPYLMNPEDHDKAMAFASHLPHLISFSLLHSIMNQDDNNINNFAAGGLKEFLRIAGSDPEMWSDIFNSNQNNIIEAVELFKDSLDEIRNKFSDKDELKELINKIKKYKENSF